MSICGALDGSILVYRSSPTCCYCPATNLPLPHHGYSTLQEGLSSILPRDKLPLPERPSNGNCNRGVWLAQTYRPQSAQDCWSETSLVRITV